MTSRGPLNRPTELTEVDGKPWSNTQKDHINIRILRNSISGIPLILGLRSRM